MANERDQSKVAYEDGPKEVNTQEGMPKSKQWGKGNKMPQENKGYKQKPYPANPMIDNSRYGENR